MFVTFLVLFLFHELSYNRKNRKKRIGNPRFDHFNSCYKHKLENYGRCDLSICFGTETYISGLLYLLQKMLENRYDLRVDPNS